MFRLYLQPGRAALCFLALGTSIGLCLGIYDSDPDLPDLEIGFQTRLGHSATPSWTEGRTYMPEMLVARQKQAQLEDVYYAESRVRSDGSRYGVRRVSNITKTPQAREILLAHNEFTALFAVEVFGQTQALLLVDFLQDERDTSDADSRFDKLRLEITNLTQTGTRRGVGQRMYALASPPSKVAAMFIDGNYHVSLPGGDVKINPANGKVKGGEHVRYQPRYFAQKAAVPWLVDTIRGLSWVGPRKIALLEKFVFGQQDRIKQAAFALGLIDSNEGLRNELQTEDPGAFTFDQSAQNMADGHWPPAPVKTTIENPDPAEGKWTPTGTKWLRRLSKSPPAFYKTVVRMDPKRPYEVVVLIAMDMRQLDLGMVAGTVNPHSSFGTRGNGRIPRDAKTIDNLVAAFNGGFQTSHGAYGMVVDRSTILPAMPYVATVAIEDDGHIKVGSWYNSINLPENIASLRQNLPPLTADGVFNPTNRRSRWGGTSSDLDLINTTRSGLGLCGENTLVYAWCRSCSADSIGRSFIAAECTYGMHLDMNPTHTGWSWYRAESTRTGQNGHIEGVLSDKGAQRMDFRVNRYIERDVKDFFYLTLRPDFTENLRELPSGFEPWDTTSSPTGPEGFVPAAAVSKNGQGTRLIALDLARTQVGIRRGDKEPDPTGTLTSAPPISLSNDAVFIDLGLANDVGFIDDGRIVSPMRPEDLALVITEGGLLIGEADEKKKQLSIRGAKSLVKQGRPTASANTKGPTRGLALVGNHLLWADGPAHTQVAQALIDMGATTAVYLPETQTPLAFINKSQELDPSSGTSTPIRKDRTETTHLYFEVKAAKARTSRLRLEDIKLSREESIRQRRLRTQIKAARQELRNLQNEKYRLWKNKTTAQPK